MKEEAKVEEMDPASLTAEERATRYMDEQYAVFDKFITEMAPDVKKIESEPDFSSRLSDLSKFTRDNRRKMDQAERREANGW